MSETYNVGVIGFGDRVGGLVKQLLQTHPNIRLAGISDPSESAAQAVHTIAPAARLFKDMDELLMDPTIGWVLIGSPNTLHREHAVGSLMAGKHVFCEKPLATSLEDCLHIREAVRRSTKSFFFGLVLRYAPLYTKIRELLDSDAIGRVVSIEANENLDFNHGGFIHQDWRRHRALAGTHMLEKCCHDIDIISWMAGDLARSVASFGGLSIFNTHNRSLQAEVGPNDQGRPAFQSWGSAQQSPFNDDKDIVDHQVVILQYTNGVCATFHTSCLSGIPERRMSLLGTKGEIRADLTTGIIELRRIGWSQPSTVYHVVSEHHGGADPVLVKSIAEWITKGETPRTSIDQAISSAITCFAIDTALDERRVVDLGPLWESLNQS